MPNVSTGSATPNPNPATEVPYVVRVLQNDSTKKGVAAVVAGILVAAITEAIWPSS